MNPDPTPAPPGPNAPSEPLWTVGTIVAVLAGLLDLLVVFGVHVSDAKETAILAFANLAAPIAVAAWGRLKVYSPATVRRMFLGRQ